MGRTGVKAMHQSADRCSGIRTRYKAAEILLLSGLCHDVHGWISSEEEVGMHPDPVGLACVMTGQDGAGDSCWAPHLIATLDWATHARALSHSHPPTALRNAVFKCYPCENARIAGLEGVIAGGGRHCRKQYNPEPPVSGQTASLGIWEGEGIHGRSCSGVCLGWEAQKAFTSARGSRPQGHLEMHMEGTRLPGSGVHGPSMPVLP